MFSIPSSWLFFSASFVWNLDLSLELSNSLQCVPMTVKAAPPPLPRLSINSPFETVHQSFHFVKYLAARISNVRQDVTGVELRDIAVERNNVLCPRRSGFAIASVFGC